MRVALGQAIKHVVRLYVVDHHWIIGLREDRTVGACRAEEGEIHVRVCGRDSTNEAVEWGCMGPEWERQNGDVFFICSGDF